MIQLTALCVSSNINNANGLSSLDAAIKFSPSSENKVIATPRPKMKRWMDERQNPMSREWRIS